MTDLDELILSAGYVLIRAGRGDVHEIREQLLVIDGVKLAHALIGPDDLICYVETHGPANFRTVLDKGIRRLIDEGLIEHTETMMILAERGEGFLGASKVYQQTPEAAWLLCDLSVGDPQPVIKELLRTRGVVNAHPVLGRHDLVVHVGARKLKTLMEILDGSIREVRGIRSTDTRLVLMRSSNAARPVSQEKVKAKRRRK